MGPSHVTFLVSDRWKVCGWCIRQLPFLNCTQHSPAEELCWWLQTSFSMSHKAGDGLSVTNWTREGEHDYLNERRMGWHKRTWIFQNPGRRENVGQSSPVTCSICTQGGKSTLQERLGQAGTWPWCSLAHTVVFMPDRRISKQSDFHLFLITKKNAPTAKKPPNNCHWNSVQDLWSERTVQRANEWKNRGATFLPTSESNLWRASTLKPDFNTNKILVIAHIPK